MRERIAAFIDDVLARVPVEVTSKLEPAEVLRRLQEGVDSEWTFAGGKGVVGRADAYGFRMRLRIAYRNSFQTFMLGTMKAEGRGTRISARTGMNPAAAVFMVVWLSIVGLTLTLGLAGLVTAAADEPVRAMLILVPLGMIASGIALVGFGRWIARDERARLIEFMERTVEGKRAI